MKTDWNNTRRIEPLKELNWTPEPIDFACEHTCSECGDLYAHPIKEPCGNVKICDDCADLYAKFLNQELGEEN